jgi:hypothetical protein
MQRKLLICLSAVIVPLLLLGLFLGLSFNPFAEGTTSAHSSKNSSKTKTASQQTQIMASEKVKQAAKATWSYWTDEKMAEAQPIETMMKNVSMNLQNGSTQEQKTRQGTQGAQGAQTPQAAAAGSIPPTLPNTTAQDQPAANASAAATQVLQGFYGAFPYSTVGKVFFHDNVTNADFVCSGTAITSANKSTVDTAGHCVAEGGSGNNWFVNWMFCPQFINNTVPQGCWTATQLFAAAGWLNNASFTNDYGSAVVAPNQAGLLTDVVGGAGAAYNLDPAQTFTALGYPQASPFNGQLMFSCTGDGTGMNAGDGTVIALTCNMTGGSSGGPWMVTVDGTFGFVNGHNDFKNTNDPNTMFSTYYNTTWLNVHNMAENA